MRGPALFVFSPVLVGLVLYLVFAFYMVYAATKPEAHKPFEQMPGDFGVTSEDVTFNPRGESLKLSGWVMTGTPDAPWLIFVHGINSQRTNAKGRRARVAPDSGARLQRTDVRPARARQVRGQRVTAGDRERYDVLGANDFAVSRGAQPGRIGLIGHSYGAGIAIMAARLEPGIAAVVADSPFRNVEAKAAGEVALRTPIPSWAADVFMPPAKVFGRLFYGIDIGELSPQRDVARLPFSILIIHGEADERTNVSHGRAIYENAPPGSGLWTPAGVGHTKAFEAYPDEYTERVSRYLASRLGN